MIPAGKVERVERKQTVDESVERRLDDVKTRG
jgi:hypothetical protein